jgi:RNA polymerase sigma factor (sigma-70 family)
MEGKMIINLKGETIDLGPVDYIDAHGNPVLTPGRSRLAEIHRGIVIPIAINIASGHDMKGKRHTLTQKVEEYEQDGMMGLVRAARKYDPEQNDCFRAYASIFIEFEIRSCIRAQKPVGIRRANQNKDKSILKKFENMYHTVSISSTVPNLKPTLDEESVKIEDTVSDKYADPLESFELQYMVDNLSEFMVGKDREIFRRVFGRCHDSVSAIAIELNLDDSSVFRTINRTIKHIRERYEIGETYSDIYRRNRWTKRPRLKFRRSKKSNATIS